MDLYHHLAHFQKITALEGQKVRRGQLIGYLGNTGASSAPHTHYEIMKGRPENWEQYTAGMTKTEVAAKYVDPDRYIDREKHIPAKYDRYTGYGFLQMIQGRNQYHPGVDINSGKHGWADLSAPVLAPCDGTVVFVDHDGRNGGWGDHMWILEHDTEIDEAFAKSLARRKLGFYLAVEQRGELWVVDENGKREYIHPDNLMEWLREIAVGISDEDLNKVPKK